MKYKIQADDFAATGPYIIERSARKEERHSRDNEVEDASRWMGEVDITEVQDGNEQHQDQLGCRHCIEKADFVNSKAKTISFHAVEQIGLYDRPRLEGPATVAISNPCRCPRATRPLH